MKPLAHSPIYPANLMLTQNPHFNQFTPTKAQKRLISAYLIVTIIYSIVVITLSVLAYTSLPPTSPYLIEMVNNWNSPIITDIQVNSTCPPNYTSIYNFTFQGTVMGCNCINISEPNIIPVLSPRNCTINEFIAGCYVAAPLSPTSFTNFATSIIDGSAAKICVLRSPNNTWNSRAVISDYECPVGMIPCGGGPNAANYSYRMCVDSSAGCGVNSIQASSMSSYDAGSCDADGSCAFIRPLPNSTALVLTWNTTANALPLAEFRLIEDTMCEFNTTDNVTPNRTLYPLLKEQITTCTLSSDWSSTWTLLFTIPEVSLFAMNNILADLTFLPTYLNYTNYTNPNVNYNWGLYARPYFSWAPQCRYWYFHQLTGNPDPAKAMFSAQVTLLIFSCFCSVIMMTFVLWIVWRKLIRKKKVSVIKAERLRLLNYVLKGLEVGAASGALVICMNNTKIFGYLAGNNCISSPTKAGSEFSRINASLNQILSYDIVILVLSVVFLAFGLVEHGVSVCRREKERPVKRTMDNSVRYDSPGRFKPSAIYDDSILKSKELDNSMLNQTINVFGDPSGRKNEMTFKETMEHDSVDYGNNSFMFEAKNKSFADNYVPYPDYYKGHRIESELDKRDSSEHKQNEPNENIEELKEGGSTKLNESSLNEDNLPEKNSLKDESGMTSGDKVTAEEQTEMKVKNYRTFLKNNNLNLQVD